MGISSIREFPTTFTSSLINNQKTRTVNKDVTEMEGDVTNLNFENGSNCSGEALHRDGHDQRKKDKKHKKRKKNKGRRDESTRHKAKPYHLHFPSSMYMPGLGEDFTAIDPTSGNSKIFPFYDQNLIH